jgi:hypothetical protein
MLLYILIDLSSGWNVISLSSQSRSQALVSFKKCMPPPLPYFKVNIYPFPLPHFASMFFAYLWSFRWPNYIVTLPRYFSFRLPHLNIPTGPPSDELDKNSQRTWLSENLSHWNGHSHFHSVLNSFRNFLKRCFKNRMSVIWSWTYFYNLHWNNYLYFKGLLYIWEEMIMMALLHMAGLENSECIWKIQRKPEVAVSVSMTEK